MEALIREGPQIRQGLEGIAGAEGLDHPGMLPVFGAVGAVVFSAGGGFGSPGQALPDVVLRGGRGGGASAGYAAERVVHPVAFPLEGVEGQVEAAPVLVLGKCCPVHIRPTAVEGG